MLNGVAFAIWAPPGFAQGVQCDKSYHPPEHYSQNGGFFFGFGQKGPVSYGVDGSCPCPRHF